MPAAPGREIAWPGRALSIAAAAHDVVSRFRRRQPYGRTAVVEADLVGSVDRPASSLLVRRPAHPRVALFRHATAVRKTRAPCAFGTDAPAVDIARVVAAVGRETLAEERRAGAVLCAVPEPSAGLAGADQGPRRGPAALTGARPAVHAAHRPPFGAIVARAQKVHPRGAASGGGRAGRRGSGARRGRARSGRARGARRGITPRRSVVAG